MMTRICCAFPTGSEAALWAETLRRALPSATVDVWTEEVPAADYAVVWQPSQAFLDAQSGLKAIFNTGSGVDALLQSRLPVGAQLIRLEDAGLAEQMSDYVCHAVLHHFREFDTYAEHARAGTWAKCAPREKSSFPVGIMGFGILGQAAAKALHNLGFDVCVWARSPRQADNVRLFVGDGALDPFLASSRILVCLLPLTPATRGILCKATFEKLQPNAYVINPARGGHLVNDDLLAAIRDGAIAGATLDVFDQEPLPEDHPLWREPRIRITPHISASRLRGPVAAQIAGKIADLEAGKPVSGVIDLTKGY
jgi:glyoxylate/hydroxypyruvate reductase